MATAPSELGNEPSRIQPEISVNLGITRYSNPSSWHFSILSPTNLLSRTHILDMVHVFYYGQPSSGKKKELADAACESSVDKDGEESLPLKDLPSQNNDSEEQLQHPEPGTPPEVSASVNDLSDEQIKQLQCPPEDNIQVLWIGHASLLIQMEGKSILTDPVFSDTVGMTKRLGYKRYRKPALTAEKFGHYKIDVDIVLISHNHYDHFDEKSIKELHALFPKLQWFVPMGLKKTLEGFGPKMVTECSWWDSCPVGVLELHFTPAKHWSARGPLDWYHSLWGSWTITSRRFTVFFAGDTGYEQEIFTRIRQQYGRIDLAAIPIGAYEPRDMMKCQHVNPEEAVKIHQDLEAKKSIGIHWRTFQLSTEEVDKPKHDLENAKEMHRLATDKFVTLERDLMITVDEEEDSEEKQEAEKDIFNNGCVCGNRDVDSYRKYKHGESVVGVLCNGCGREWLKDIYMNKSPVVKGNSLLFEKTMLYLHDVAEVPSTCTEENKMISKPFSEIRVGDHVTWCEGRETSEMCYNHGIVEDVDNKGDALDVAMIERGVHGNCKITHKQMKRSEIEEKKDSTIVNCDPPELVKARIMAWRDPETMNSFESEVSCFFRYCRRGPDYSFKVCLFVIHPLIDSLKGLNADYNASEIKDIGVLVKISGTSITLDLKNYDDEKDDLTRNRLDDIFCENLVKSLSEKGSCKVVKKENKTMREYEVRVSKAHVQATFSVQCIKKGQIFHVANGTYTDQKLGSRVGKLIQKSVKTSDRQVTLEELKSGDHVVLSGTLWHPRCHAIVISVDIKEKQLRLIRSTYEKGVVEEWVKAPSYLLRVAPDDNINTEKMIWEARAQIGERNEYNIVTNNCKHFVYKCKEKSS